MYEKIAMKRHEVESSNIKSIGHSFPRRLLEIEFNDGNIYRYKGVNHKTYRALMNAESKGREFHKNIKYSYPYKKYKDNGFLVTAVNASIYGMSVDNVHIIHA